MGVALTALVCAPCRAVELELPDPYTDEEGLKEQAGKGPAVEHFNLGVELFKKEQYEPALTEFVESYSITPNWAVLYNIGVCENRMGLFIEAIDHLEEYLERGGAWIPSGRRTFVEKLLKAMREATGVIVIHHPEPGVRVWLDGKRTYDTPVDEPIRVTVGLHTITAHAEGYWPVTMQVSISAGDLEEIELDMEPTPLLLAWMEVTGTGTYLSVPARLRIAAWASWGLAGLALGGALVTSSIELARGDANGDLRLATTALLISAGGAAITGLILWLAHRVSVRRRFGDRVPWLAVAPAAGGGVGLVVGLGALPPSG
jgi:hypothetical protein